MDDSFMLLFDFISLGAGGYCLFTCFKLKLANGRLFSNGLLIPKGLTEKDCTDQAGYCAYMLPRLLIFAVALTLYACVSVADTLLDFLDFWVRQGLIGMAFLVIVWYGIVSSRANKKYWNMSKISSSKPPRHL